MIISVNWLKKFTDIDLPIDELATLIGSRLVEIEGVVDLSKKYEGVVVVKIVECNPVEGSDHLNVTKIDDGGVVKDVERDENGLVQVVCGAPNARVGLLTAWLAPGVTLPETYDDPKPVVLQARPLRGVVSNGMLASPKEVAVGELHDGIIELDETLTPGTNFANVFELKDYLLDIENKSLTHRPDTFGIVGFAREVAGIQGKNFETPKQLLHENIEWIQKEGDAPTPTITIDDPKLSTRYQAVVLGNVDSKVNSPLETQTYLSRIGVRPHSAVVDATNYLMMVTGQPLHAFDYDKLKSVNNGEVAIHVRAGHDGEKLVLLDGREIELTNGDIVIANGETAVALAGAMGGRDTEIDESTTNVLLESASFNLYNLRNTQMRHGIFSEAITRFTKGQPAALTEPVLAEATKLLAESAGAKRVSDVGDAYSDTSNSQPVTVSHHAINEALGDSYEADVITRTLENVGFMVEMQEDTFVVTPPYWRTDIHIAEDIIEEVGRLNGFDKIPPTLPKRDFTAVSPDTFDQFRSHVRAMLARGGANEVLTYSFIHGDVIKKAAQNIENAYRIVNSISPDLQYYRLTLTPSLLTLLQPNAKMGYGDFALFELNKTHSKIFGMDDDDTPKETDLLAAVVHKKSQESGYYHAKRLLDYIASSFDLSFVYAPIGADPGYDESAPFDYKRSAMVSDKTSGEYIGIIGEYKTSVKKAFKLDGAVAGFELDPRALHRASVAVTNSYVPLSRYPSTERDVCYKVSGDTAYSMLTAAAQKYQNDDVAVTIAPLDIYQEEDADTKNITLRFTLTPGTKTLSSDEANQIVSKISDHVIEATKATII